MEKRRLFALCVSALGIAAADPVELSAQYALQPAGVQATAQNEITVVQRRLEEFPRIAPESVVVKYGRGGQLRMHIDFRDPRDATPEERKFYEHALLLLTCTPQGEASEVARRYDDIKLPKDQTAYLQGWVAGNASKYMTADGLACSDGRPLGRKSIRVEKLQHFSRHHDPTKFDSVFDFRGVRYNLGFGFSSKKNVLQQMRPDPDILCQQSKNAEFRTYFIRDARQNEPYFSQLRELTQQASCNLDAAGREAFRLRTDSLSPRIMSSNIGPNGMSGHWILNMTQYRGIGFELDGYGTLLPYYEYLMENCLNSGKPIQEVVMTFEPLIREVIAKPDTACNCAAPTVRVERPEPTPVVPTVRARGPNVWPWIAGIIAVGGLAAWFLTQNGHSKGAAGGPDDLSPRTRAYVGSMGDRSAVVAPAPQVRGPGFTYRIP